MALLAVPKNAPTSDPRFELLQMQRTLLDNSSDGRQIEHCFNQLYQLASDAAKTHSAGIDPKRFARSLSTNSELLEHAKRFRSTLRRLFELERDKHLCRGDTMQLNFCSEAHKSAAIARLLGSARRLQALSALAAK